MLGRAHASDDVETGTAQVGDGVGAEALRGAARVDAPAVQHEVPFGLGGAQVGPAGRLIDGADVPRGRVGVREGQLVPTVARQHP